MTIPSADRNVWYERFNAELESLTSTHDCEANAASQVVKKWVGDNKELENLVSAIAYASWKQGLTEGIQVSFDPQQLQSVEEESD